MWDVEGTPWRSLARPPKMGCQIRSCNIAHNGARSPCGERSLRSRTLELVMWTYHPRELVTSRVFGYLCLWGMEWERGARRCRPQLIPNEHQYGCLAAPFDVYTELCHQHTYLYVFRFFLSGTHNLFGNGPIATPLCTFFLLLAYSRTFRLITLPKCIYEAPVTSTSHQTT